MAERCFFGFFARSLDALEREVPESHARIGQGLGSRAIHVCVDGGARRFRFVDGRHVLEDENGTETLSVRTNRDAIVRLVEAKTTLLDAIEQDELWLRGSPDDIVVLYDLLVEYVRGAVRSRSLPPLLHAYLDDSPATGSESKRATGTRLAGQGREETR